MGIPTGKNRRYSNEGQAATCAAGFQEGVRSSFLKPEGVVFS